jgi:uncharacterized cupredoxin-like copper-binding protein
MKTNGRRRCASERREQIIMEGSWVLRRLRICSLSIFWTILTLACDGGPQSITLTAQDNRFDPTFVHVEAGRPLTLMVFNAGREIHEFASPLMLYARQPTAHGASRQSDSESVTLEPGQSVQLLMEAPAGTYLYWCKRKGHHMSGTMIIN